MKIEEYIRNNRQKLDVEKPDEDFLWAGISQSLNSKQKHRSLSIWKYASAVAASVAVTLIAVHFWNAEPKQQLIFVNIDPSLAKQEVELKAQIQDYTQQIHQANYNLNDLPTNLNDLKYIDDLIEKYSKDLKQYGPNPQLIESLMDLYNKKVLMLQRMLNEIEKNKNYEKRRIDI